MANQPRTVKVTFFGEEEDLAKFFATVGHVTTTPFVFKGNPSYSYIDFATPDEAQAALMLNGSYIKGTRMIVKLKQSTRIPIESQLSAYLFVHVNLQPPL